MLTCTQKHTTKYFSLENGSLWFVTNLTGRKKFTKSFSKNPSTHEGWQGSKGHRYYKTSFEGFGLNVYYGSMDINTNIIILKKLSVHIDYWKKKIEQNKEHYNAIALYTGLSRCTTVSIELLSIYVEKLKHYIILIVSLFIKYWLIDWLLIRY